MNHEQLATFSIHAPKCISFLKQLSNEKLVPHLTPIKQQCTVVVVLAYNY